MAYFKPIQKKRNLPQAPEESSIGGASLYDALIETVWRGIMDEYDRRGVGWNIAGESTIPYPDKEVWWDDPSSRLPLLHEFNKYYPKEVLERERLLKEETNAMEEAFLKLLLDRPAPQRQTNDRRRVGGRGRA